MANKHFLFGAAAALGLFSVAAQGAAGYYKCVDKDGHVTGYASAKESCPSQKTIEMEKGREVTRKKEPERATAKVASPADTPEQIEQKRRDDALLGTYTTEDEIDQALKRNLQQVDARINTIQLQIKSAQDDQDRLAKDKADMEKAGKPADRGLLNEITQTNARIAKLQSELTKAQAEAEAIKARFAADKQRFRELTAGQK